MIMTNDVAKLKGPSVSEQFNIKLRNRYRILQDETAITIDRHVRNDFAAVAIGYIREPVQRQSDCFVTEEREKANGKFPRCQVDKNERKVSLLAHRER